MRIQVKPEYRGEVGLKTIAVDVLQKLLNLQVSDIFALQDFVVSGQYDVSFHTEDTCQAAYENWVKADLGGNLLTKKMDVSLLFDPGLKTMTVHCYNPFLEPELVRQFLLRYCVGADRGEKLYNQYGMYRGKLRFKVRMKRDASGFCGVCHPPPAFTIAGERCTVFYSGQPRYCRGCFQYGHIREDCPSKLCCRVCLKPGHNAAECKEKKCDLCGSGEHMVRNCPKIVGRKMFSYAEAVQRWRFTGQNVSREPEEQETEQADDGGDDPPRR